MPIYLSKKQNKYHNKKIIVNGEKFDSKKEYVRFRQLELLEKSGHITDLKRQVKFVLIPTLREEPTEVYKKGPQKGQPKQGKVLEKETAYIADFVYQKDGKTVVEDAKGMRTKDYILKRKLMLWVHKIRIEEI